MCRNVAVLLGLLLSFLLRGVVCGTRGMPS